MLFQARGSVNPVSVGVACPGKVSDKSSGRRQVLV